MNKNVVSIRNDVEIAVTAAVSPGCTNCRTRTGDPSHRRAESETAHRSPSCTKHSATSETGIKLGGKRCEIKRSPSIDLTDDCTC